MSTTNFQRLMGLLLLVGVTVLLALVTQNASAATLTVDDDGDAEYTKIQDAIDNATAGDTIRVWEGTYEENVVIDKMVNLIGNGSEDTIIDGRGNGSAIKTSSYDVTVSRFYVTGSGSNRVEHDAGILVEGDNCTIIENNCSNNRDGIYLYYSNNNKLSNNTCFSNNYFGIELEHSNFNMLSKNNCSNNDGAGVVLWRSDNNALANNICLNNEGDGIWFYKDSNHNAISNNTCSNNEDDGISLDDSDHNTITNNTCSNNGYNGIKLVFESNFNIITNNYCLNNDIIGIGVGRSSEYNSIMNNICNENGQSYEYIMAGGIGIFDSGNNTITNNNCISNIEYGIVLESCQFNTVMNNTCKSNRESGIYLDVEDPCKFNNIMNNNCSNNLNYGIMLKSSTFNSIMNNNCSNNLCGIYLLESTENTIMSNNCSNNYGGAGSFWDTQYGIYFESSGSNIIAYNTISANDVGIFLLGSSMSNTAHHNNIFNNKNFGISTTETINATDNWWGKESGPYHPDDNPDGKGDNITDNVLFDPWLDEISENQMPTAHIDSITPNPAEKNQTITFTGSGTDDGTITRYSCRSSIDGPLYNGTDHSFTLFDLSVGNHTIFLKVMDNLGAWSDEVSTALDVKEITVKVENKDDGDEGFLPGFELVILISSIAISVTIRRRK